MPVIGTLTVNLEANTAKFTGDLGKADDATKRWIKRLLGASKDAQYSMMEARHSVMILGEEIGVHLPRSLTAFIAGLGPVGPALEAAFPFLAIVLGATLLIEHMRKVSDAADKTAAAQRALGLASTEAFNGVGDKILQVEKRIDELNGNHIAALRKELTLINHATLKDLMGEFDRLAGEADKVFGGMKAGLLETWLLGGQGGKGAKHALEEFKLEYDQLLASGDTSGAHNKLVGTLDAAQKKMEEMQRSGMAARSPVDLDAQFKLISFLQTELDLEKQHNTLLQERTKLAKGEEAKREADDQARLYSEQQKGLNQYLKEYHRMLRERADARRDAAKDAVRMENEEWAATEAVARIIARQNQALALEDAKAVEQAARLRLAAQDEAARHALGMRQITDRQATAEEIKAAQERERIEVAALDSAIAALDRYDAEYLVKLRGLENKKKQIIQQSEQEITAIRDKAEEQRNTRILSAEHRFDDEIARGLAQVIMRHESFGKMMLDIGNQVVAGIISNSIKAILANDMTKPSDANAAARKAWVAGTHFPFPLDIVMPPVLAAAAFAGVMAYEGGGEIPGAGPVPIIAHGGETVVTRALTEQVKNSTGAGGGHHITYAPNIQVLDATGLHRVLSRHESVFMSHVNSALRKMNA